MAVWRRVAQKAKEKGRRTTEERKTEEEETEEETEGKRGREMGGFEAAVKRGRVRVGPSQLAGRVDADRESEGWMDGRG